MKKASMICMLIGISYGMDAHGMEYVWRKYVQLRDPAIVAELKPKEGNIQQKDVLQVVQKYYEQEKPLYIKVLSYVSPLESEEDVVNRAYHSLDARFKAAFYPDKNNPTELFIDLPVEHAQKLANIENLIVYGKQNKKVPKDQLVKLINTIKTFVGDVQQIQGLADQDSQRLASFLKQLDELITILNQPRISLIERWHRNRVVGRIKSYFNLQ